MEVIQFKNGLVIYDNNYYKLYQQPIAPLIFPKTAEEEAFKSSPKATLAWLRKLRISWVNKNT